MRFRGVDYYNIYRSEGRSPIDVEDPKYLYKITPDSQTSFIDSGLDSSKNYYYWIAALDDADNEGLATGVKKATAVMEIPIAQIPTGFELKSNFPNPFNSQTTIQFIIPRTIAGEKVKLIIYDGLGKRVKMLKNEKTREV